MSKSVEFSANKAADNRNRIRVAAYCRVSTEHEEQDGSIEIQESYFKGKIVSTHFPFLNILPFPISFPLTKFPE